MSELAPPFDERLEIATGKVVFLELPGSTVRQCFLYRPESARPGAPLVVSVHGIGRSAAAHVYRLVDQADRLGVCVLAPLFEKAKYGQYQQLIDPRSGVRSDLALLDMIRHASLLTGADASRLLLLGYSGGAQFAHRFAMAYPTRVASVVLAAAGWYTMPEPEADYPLGLDTATLGGDLQLDLDAFLAVPMHVLVGDLDTVRDRSLRRSDLIDGTQGRTRVARARSWVAAINAACVARNLPLSADLSLLPGVGHSFSDAIERTHLAVLAFEHFACDAASGPHK